MVKFSASKSRLSQSFKNLKGSDTILRIDKQGRCVSVTLEQKIVSWGYLFAFYVLGSALTLLLIYNFVLPDVNVIAYVTAILFIILFYYFLSAVHEESLIMIHSLGYQITSKSVIGQRDLFIPWNQVQSIFINEVIIRHKVIHLLSILTKDQGEERLIPLFITMQPRLKHLELICKHLRGANS